MKKVKLLLLFLFWIIPFCFIACSDDEVGGGNGNDDDSWIDVTASSANWDGEKRADISYQLLVYSFADSDGDKCGDIRGLITKLDYLADLGIKAIWLSPIHPAMSYHGYDVTDYSGLNPQYGTMADFEELVAKAHNLGIKIYLDYVMNHTGSAHPWFKEAKTSPDNTYRDYYIFSQDPKSDITAGKIPMIKRESSMGYNAGEWFSAGIGDAMKGCYKFVLDWSNAASPTITVTEGDTPDVDNADVATQGAKYLYYGEGICKKFYAKDNNKYELTVDLDTDWGFLIRTSNTSWDNGTKYGAPSKASKIQLGKAFTLSNTTPEDILFASVEAWYFHSHFQTDWFADLNYGAIDDAADSPAYKAISAAAKKWIDRGIDGFRLDAVKHIYHSATSDENPRFLKMFYDDMNAYYKAKGHTDDIYIVGEVLSGSDEVAPYYQGLPALFEFDFWYKLDWAIANSTGCYFAKDILSFQQKYARYRTDYIEATKLSNHDEDRTASKLGKSEAKCKLAAVVLLTAPGEPYIYYGEELGIYGTKEKADEYVRSPMLWGDNYTTSYTDKIDATVASNIKSVTEQKENANSLLNTYISFIRLRNTYPSLAQGIMTKHAVYNESNEKYKSIAAWYMTKDNEKMLVLHNFGNASVELSLTDNIEKTVGVSGTVQVKDGDDTSIRLGGYSSVVYKIAQYSVYSYIFISTLFSHSHRKRNQRRVLICFPPNRSTNSRYPCLRKGNPTSINSRCR